MMDTRVKPAYDDRACGSGIGLNAIAHDVVTKPFSVADIRTAVADALAAGRKR